MSNHRPNILVILTDDQGPWAMGCAGNAEIHTPNLDRLAASGIRFENFFCASPVCSPARASLLTGRMPSQHGVHDWLAAGNFAGRAPGVHGSDPCAIEYLGGIAGYSDILAAAGYTCGLSGKWHLGDSVRPQKGFSHWFAHREGGGPYYGAPMIRDGVIRTEDGYVTDVITDDALAFLDGRKEADTPFLCEVHYTAPHSPWAASEHPPEAVERYRNCPFESTPNVPMHPSFRAKHLWDGSDAGRRRSLIGYYAAITEMDRNVGRILDKLDELGLRESTLVFFVSDNGMNMGHHGIFGKGNGTFPQNMYDESVKVPAIMSMPGTLPEGRTETGLHSQYDWMPTLLDFLGLENPEESDLPGRSFARLLRGEPMPGRDSVVVYDEYGPVRMIRDHEWKYVHRYPYGPHELYHLAEDPGENCNLIDDPAVTARIESMRADLHDFFLRYADPDRDGSKLPVTGEGQTGRVGRGGKGRTAFRSKARP
jgi:arylsulfatase A-like enzyme